jgi:hypothetical protein
MGLKHISQEWRTKPIRSYYHWMNKGKLWPLLKYTWTGIWLTSTLLLEFGVTFLVIFMGFMIREIYCLLFDREYVGHPILH